MILKMCIQCGNCVENIQDCDYCNGRKRNIKRKIIRTAAEMQADSILKRRESLRKKRIAKRNIKKGIASV